MKFAKQHRDRSLRWPHPKVPDDTPEHDEASGFVLFKNCVIDRSSPCNGVLDDKPERVTSLCEWSEAAMDAHGIPVTLGHENEGSPHASETAGFIDGSVRIVEEAGVRIAVCDIVITSRRAKVAIAEGLRGLSRDCGLVVVRDGMDEVITLNTSMDHVALLTDPGVEGACLTNAEMWVDDTNWTW